MIYMLDTDTVILMMRGLKITNPRNENQRERQVRGRRIFNRSKRRARAGNVISLSAITIAELHYGASRADSPDLERRNMEHVLAPFAAFDFDAVNAASEYGNVRSRLESEGNLIGPNDLLIAAHALALGASVVTNNTREFKRVSSLKCENWSL
jgi:tRNA(fMet)-specific endonuclease VapC